jgi:YVTN family beta-propeller protein
MAPSTPRRRTTGMLLLALIALVGLTGSAAAAEGPPARPGTTQVLFVANNWDGTADLVDQDSFEVLRRIDVVPDLEERLAEIRSDPVRLGYYLGIQQLVGEGHDQYADDMFTSHDGRFLYVSRPSLADVVGLDLATEQIVWRFPMEGQRSDHMAISPDSTRLMVSDSTANKVHVLDAASGQKVGEFASGDSPHENNYSQDGSRVFHASIGLVYTPADRPLLDSTKGERYLQIVDTATLEVERYDLGENLARREAAVEGEPYPDSSAIRPMAISPDERTAYLQLSFFHGYVAYDLERHVITQVVSLPNLVPDVPREQYLLDSAHHGLALNPDGSRLCAAGTMSDYAAIVPVDDPGAAVLVEGVDTPYWSTNSGDGRLCFVSASGSDEVVVIDYASGREITRVPVGDHPQRMRLGVVRTELLAAPGQPGAAPAGPAPAVEVLAAERALPATGGLLALPLVLLLTAGGLLVLRRRIPAV